MAELHGKLEDGDDCPIEVRLHGPDVGLFIPSEQLCVLLEPSVALALGRSLIAAAEEATA